jgi:phospholipid/cholesterol/gamma-HCH transport system ATP-binding protein
LPPVDETPLEIPPELIREEVREVQENGSAPPPTTKPEPYIVFDHVSKSFGDLVVLDDVSFEVLAGETVCILGRSGVGKSVTLQQIMGFLKPDKGRILVAGEDITGFSDQQMEEVRKNVTMVFQSGALFDSLSVAENVAFPLRERKGLEEDQIQKIVSGLLEMVGVTGATNLLPSDLSTGMKRSVAIARAMASQPQAILYDEPTTMVDPLIGRLLGNLIEKLKTQLLLTSIVVTHDMRFAERLADHVVFLHQGKVLFFGTMEEMKRSDDEILRQFLELDSLVLPNV